MFEYTNHKQELHGYQDNSDVKIYLIVNTVKKTLIKDRDLPVMLIMNYAELIDDNEKNNLLLSHLR